MKKTAFIAMLPVLALALVAGKVAMAQNAPGAGAAIGASGSGSASAGTATIAPPAPVPGDAGFVQFNSLTVESVSGTGVPAEITAMPQVTIMSGGAAGGGTGSASGGAMSSGNAASNCLRFDTQNAGKGMVIPCPIAPPVPAPSASNGTSPANGPAIMTVPPIGAFRIEVSANTEIMLRDRTAASLADISAGDQINVFGYYNTDGSIQAYVVRDTSKPVETQTMQLNNVSVVSVSGTSIPATLTVTQTVGAPCYHFNTNGAQAPIACPLGIIAPAQVPAPSSNAANTSSAPTAPTVAPNYMMLRRYSVNVDARTIVLDRNRNALTLADIHQGDRLNVYGETSDNGQTIAADIIRDLSLPVAPSTYMGTVTQVNPDGSFTVQTNDGRTFTVQGPVAAGESVSVDGLLNQSGTVLTGVTRLSVSSGTAYPPQPPVMLPMMRVQGSPYPTSTNGKPINY